MVQGASIVMMKQGNTWQYYVFFHFIAYYVVDLFYFFPLDATDEIYWTWYENEKLSPLADQNKAQPSFGMNMRTVFPSRSRVMTKTYAI